MEDQLSVNRRQFQILLQQLNVTEDTMIRHLEGGQIIKLTVHKNKKTWHFHFKLRNVLHYP
ncbi:PolC-type DNA polymerase III N-terminal domain-containing protein, partial [Bacillus licheniformis]|uniref:PolC-type DNA polymerase III N-terminal domain-containing protein n=1 Tax=Bacillus licheniformis TaxID=1402 RepID=UPI0022826F0D